MVEVRVRVRVIITIIPRNGGPPEWRTSGMADPNQVLLHFKDDIGFFVDFDGLRGFRFCHVDFVDFDS